MTDTERDFAAAHLRALADGLEAGTLELFTWQFKIVTGDVRAPGELPRPERHGERLKFEVRDKAAWERFLQASALRAVTETMRTVREAGVNATCDANFGEREQNG